MDLCIKKHIEKQGKRYSSPCLTIFQIGLFDFSKFQVQECQEA